MSIAADSARGIGNGVGFSSSNESSSNSAHDGPGRGYVGQDDRRVSPVPPSLRGAGLGFGDSRPSIDGGGNSPDPNVPALTLQRPSEPTSLPPLEYFGQHRSPPAPQQSPHGSHSFARDGPSHGLSSSSQRLPSLSSMHSHPSSGLRGTYDGSQPPSPSSSAATTPTPVAPYGSTPHSSSSPSGSRPFASGPPSPTSMRNGGGDPSFPISRQLAPLSLNNSGPGADSIDKSPLNMFPRPTVSPPHAHPPMRPSPLSTGVLPPLHHQPGPSPGASERDFYARRESMSGGGSHQHQQGAPGGGHFPRPPGIPSTHPPPAAASPAGDEYPVRRHSIAVFQDSHELPAGVAAGPSSLRMRVAGQPSSGSSSPLARRGSLYPRHAPPAASGGSWQGSGDLPTKIEEDVDMESKTRGSAQATGASSVADLTHVSERRSSINHPGLGRKRKSVQEGVNTDRPPYHNGEPPSQYLPQQPIHSSPPSFKPPPLPPTNKQQPTFLNPFQPPHPPSASSGLHRQHSQELLPPPAKRRGSAYDARSIQAAPGPNNMLPPGPNDYYSHADAFRRDSAASMYSHSSSQGGYGTSNTSYSIMDEKPAIHAGGHGGDAGGSIVTAEMWPDRVSPGNNDDKSSSPSGSSNDPSRRALSTLPKSARDAVLSAGHAGYSRSPELRESHKMAERKRRKDMKVMFDELLEVLPPERHPKTSKWEILSRCVDYIRDAESHAAHMRQSIKSLQQENDYLRNQLRGGGPAPPSNGHFDGPGRRNDSLTLAPLGPMPSHSSTEHSSASSSAVDYSPARSP